MQLMSIKTGLLCVLLLKTYIRERGGLGSKSRRRRHDLTILSPPVQKTLLRHCPLGTPLNTWKKTLGICLPKKSLVTPLAFASEVADLGLILSRVKPMTLKLTFTASLLAPSIKGTVWNTSRQMYLYRWKRYTGFLHLSVVDRFAFCIQLHIYSPITTHETAIDAPYELA